MALESQIAERQAAWDAKYAEYQKMLANSGGRLNRTGQAKVARLDAEAREIKAEIDAAKEQRARLEEELEDLVEEARRDLERAQRAREEAERRERRYAEDGVDPSEPRRSSDSSEDGLQRRGRVSAGPDSPVRAGSTDKSARSPAAGEVLTLRPHLDDFVWIFDPLDPVGGRGALTAEVLRRTVEMKFGKAVVSDDYTVEPIFYAGGGRRAIEGKAVDFMKSSAGSDSKHEMKVFEESRGDASVSLDHAVVSLSYEDGHAGAERIIDVRERAAGRLVVRLEEHGDSHVLVQYDKDGIECGRIKTDFERAGDARRPVEMQVTGDGIYRYRIGQHPFGGSPFTDGKTAIYRWSYDESGRVSRLEQTTVDRSRDTQYMRDAIQASGSDRREMFEYAFELSERSYEEWLYDYDDKGRLLDVTTRVVVRTLGMLDQSRLMSKDTRDDELALRMIEQKLASDPGLEFRTAPGDGIDIEPYERGVQRVITKRFRCTQWDERGRWTKMSLFALDKAGESELQRIDRILLEQDGGADHPGREWQLFGLAPEEGEVKHRLLARSFSGNGAGLDPDEAPAPSSTASAERVVDETSVGVGGVGVLLLVAATALLVAAVALIVVLMMRRRAG